MPDTDERKQAVRRLIDATAPDPDSEWWRLAGMAQAVAELQQWHERNLTKLAEKLATIKDQRRIDILAGLSVVHEQTIRLLIERSRVILADMELLDIERESKLHHEMLRREVNWKYGNRDAQ